MNETQEHKDSKNKFNQRLDGKEYCHSHYCKKLIPKGQGFCNQKCCDDEQGYQATIDELGF